MKVRGNIYYTPISTLQDVCGAVDTIGKHFIYEISTQINIVIFKVFTCGHALKHPTNGASWFDPVNLEPLR